MVGTSAQGLNEISVASVIEEGRLGGPQVRMARIASSLSGSVIKNTVVFPGNDSEQFKTLLDSLNISYRQLFLSRLSKQCLPLLRYFLCLPFEIIHLARYLKKEKFEIIHCSGGAWQIKAVLAGALNGQLTIWHLNDTYMPTEIRKIFSVLNRFVDGYIFSSAATEKYYRPLIRDSKPATIIRQPVDAQVFSRNNSLLDTKIFANKWPGKTIVTTIANINPIKNIEMFLRVANIVGQSNPELLFIVAGPVPDSQKRYYQQLLQLMKKLKLDNVEFIGSVVNSAELLLHTDIFLCTSRKESGPMTVWEAMSMEVPVISTNVGDVSQFLTKVDCGYFVETGDYKGMGEKVVLLANNSTMRKKLGKNGRQEVLKSFNQDILAQSYIDFYASMVNKN